MNTYYCNRCKKKFEAYWLSGDKDYIFWLCPYCKSEWIEPYKSKKSKKRVRKEKMPTRWKKNGR